MKNLKKISLALASALGSLAGFAQQDAMYTHYMYNTLAINPAYAGSRDALTVTALDRYQWVGFSGAPMTQTLTMHAPIEDQHIGLGLSLLNDKIGPTNNTSLFADFSYIMQVTEKSKLALGLSAGVNIFQASLNTLQLDQQSDPVFQTNINNKVTPNIGFGAYYYMERFYIGVSVPGLIQNNLSAITQENGNTLIGVEQRNYYLIAGTVINLSDNVALKPTALLKVTQGAPAQADLTGCFIIMKKFLIGAMYRTGDAWGVLVGLDLTDQLHLGYSYDYSYGLSSSLYNSGSHEIMVRYDFLSIGKKQIHSPRYF